jgi:hypothetical protein
MGASAAAEGVYEGLAGMARHAGDGRGGRAGSWRWGRVAAVVERNRACFCRTAPSQQPRNARVSADWPALRDAGSRERGVRNDSDDASRRAVNLTGLAPLRHQLRQTVVAVMSRCMQCCWKGTRAEEACTFHLPELH